MIGELFGSQDIYGGTRVGLAGVGELVGGEGAKYFFEKIPERSEWQMVVYREGENNGVVLLELWQEPDGKFSIMAPERVAALYNGDGTLRWASLFVTAELWRRSCEGEICLADDVVEGLRNQRLNQTAWIVSLKFATGGERVEFNRVGSSKMEFRYLAEPWIAYPIPGLSSMVILAETMRTYGFTVSGVDGKSKGYWFWKRIGSELPTEENLRRLTLADLYGLAFPFCRYMEG